MGVVGRVIDAAAAVTQVSEGVDNAVHLGRMTASGASGVRRGGAGLYHLGVASRHRAADDRAGAGRAGTGSPAVGGVSVLVGGSLYHSDVERALVLDQLDRAIAQFRAEVEPVANAAGSPPARRQWWIVDVVPVIVQWTEFRQREVQSWMTRFVTDWSVYAGWLARLQSLRSAARLQGIALVSPEPVELPETVLERGHAGRGGLLETLWTFLKTIVYAAVGVVGVLSLYAVYKDVRGPKAVEA